MVLCSGRLGELTIVASAPQENFSTLPDWRDSKIQSVGFCSVQASTPCASLTFLTGSRTRKSSVSLNAAAPRSSLLHCSFVPSSSLSSPSSFLGLSLGLDLSSSTGVGRRRGSGLVVRDGKAALCLTKRNGSRKSLARTHGLRRRMRTTGGRAMLKRRRAKGRKILCTKTNPNSGKRA